MCQFTRIAITSINELGFMSRNFTQFVVNCGPEFSNKKKTRSESVYIFRQFFLLLRSYVWEVGGEGSGDLGV